MRAGVGAGRGGRDLTPIPLSGAERGRRGVGGRGRGWRGGGAGWRGGRAGGWAGRAASLQDSFQFFGGFTGHTGDGGELINGSGADAVERAKGLEQRLAAARADAGDLFEGR